MGLDQYLYVSKESLLTKTHKEWYLENPDDWFEPSTEEEANKLHTALMNKKEIAYWRKHANLQGFIEDLVNNKDINCEFIELTEDNVKTILKASEEKSMDKATGFFWGETVDDDYNHTVVAMKHALFYIAEGYKIYYYCWY